MGTTAYGGKGSKGRAANGDRPLGAASCRREQHTMASCQNPHTTPQQLPLQPCHRRSNTDTNNGGTRTPMQQQYRQPITAQDSPEKMPGAPRALGDVPTETLQG